MKKVEAGKVVYFIDDYVSSKLYTQKYVDKKDKVINELLKRISDLEFEVERLEKEHEEARIYIHINYPVCSGKDLLDILKGVNKE